MTDHATMRARVRIYLQAGMTYNEAIFKAYQTLKETAAAAETDESGIRSVGGGWRAAAPRS